MSALRTLLGGVVLLTVACGSVGSGKDGGAGGSDGGGAGGETADAAADGATGGAGGGGSGGVGGGASDGGPADQTADHGPDTPDKSCNDVKIRLATTTDGLYLIHPDGLRPFEVWCQGMGTTMPAEFLTLAAVSTSGQKASNYSEYVYGPVHGGQLCPCNSRLTRFSRVRLDPRTLTVTTRDTTFAVVDLVDPSATCFSAAAANCPTGADQYAWAGSCVTGNFAGGHANVNLTGTPFHIGASATFASDGYLPTGMGQVSADRKTADLTGGGDCGWYDATSLVLEQDAP